MVQFIGSADATPQRRVQLSGGPLNVVDVGTGDALVFLHAWQASGESWRAQIEHFVDSHRVIVPDLPGFGRSTRHAVPRTLPGYAGVVTELLDALDVPAATFIGNSMGGFIAAELGLMAPDRVNGLVLVAAAGMSRRYVLPTAFLRTPIGIAITRIVLGADPVRGRALRAAAPIVGRAVFAHVDRLPPDEVQRLAAGLGRAGAYRAFRACVRHDHRDELHRLTCPTLVVWGRRDRLMSVRNAYRYGRAIAHAQVLVYPEAGHFPQIENPGLFNRDLAAWLASTQSREEHAS
jgi:pimeloyl-ACP methyl ester carboxylesterase